MKTKLTLIVALAAVLFATAALAHPTIEQKRPCHQEAPCRIG